MKLPKTVPKKFHNLFWDVDVKKLNPSEKPYFVIQRLLSWDDFSSSTWVLKHFPKNQLKYTLTSMRGWSKISANFWSVYLNIPREELMCNRQGFPNPPVSHWNR